MNQYSFLLEVHPVVANAWKNNAVKSAIIGGVTGGTINKMRGGSFTNGALVGGAVGVAGNGLYQTNKMLKPIKQLDKVHSTAKSNLSNLAKEVRKTKGLKHNARKMSKLNDSIAKQTERSNRSFAQQVKRDNTAKALRDARRTGNKDALYKIVSQSHDVMNNPQRILRGTNLKGARDTTYIQSLRKNRI